MKRVVMNETILFTYAIRPVVGPALRQFCLSEDVMNSGIQLGVKLVFEVADQELNKP